MCDPREIPTRRLAADFVIIAIQNRFQHLYGPTRHFLFVVVSVLGIAIARKTLARVSIHSDGVLVLWLSTSTILREWESMRPSHETKPLVDGIALHKRPSCRHLMWVPGARHLCPIVSRQSDHRFQRSAPTSQFLCQEEHVVVFVDDILDAAEICCVSLDSIQCAGDGKNTTKKILSRRAIRWEKALFASSIGKRMNMFRQNWAIIRECSWWCLPRYYKD